MAEKPRLLRSRARRGDIGGHRRMAMAALSPHRALLPLLLLVAVPPAGHAQTAAPAPAGATAAWTLKMKGDIRWQQVTPAGALPLSPPPAPSGGEIERGPAARGKPA